MIRRFGVGLETIEKIGLSMSRADVIKRYSNGGPLLVYATCELPEDKVDQPIGPGEWTIRQVIAHLVDSDLNGAERMKRVIAEENPTFKTSMQLGAGRLTRSHLKGDPFTAKSLKGLEEYIEDQIEPLARSLATFEKDVAAGTSKTFRTLAKLAQNLHPKLGAHLTLDALDQLVPEIQGLDLDKRIELPGVSMERAHQLVAGSMVARQLMRTLNLKEIRICPWALREGIVLHRLDWIER